MPLSKQQRTHIALLLYLSILLSGFSCALTHSAHLALGLALGQVAFCSLGEGLSDSSLVADPMLKEHSGSPSLPFNCPLCQLTTLSLTLVLALICLLRRRPALVPAWPPLQPLSPRQAWPPANPRAP